MNASPYIRVLCVLLLFLSFFIEFFITCTITVNAYIPSDTYCIENRNDNIYAGRLINVSPL